MHLLTSAFALPDAAPNLAKAPLETLRKLLAKPYNGIFHPIFGHHSPLTFTNIRYY